MLLLGGPGPESGKWAALSCRVERTVLLGQGRDFGLVPFALAPREFTRATEGMGELTLIKGGDTRKSVFLNNKLPRWRQGEPSKAKEDPKNIPSDSTFEKSRSLAGDTFPEVPSSARRLP